MKKIASALFTLIALFGACKKYETQFDGPYSDETGGISQPIIYAIAFVNNGQVQMVDERCRNIKTFAGINGAQQVSINNQHTKLAYKKPGADIVVIDSAGTVLNTIPNSKGVVWFDFHANGETVYLLENYNLTFFGPSINPVVTNLKSAYPVIGGSDYEINAAAVATDGSVVWAYSFYDGFGYRRGVYCRRKDGTKTDYNLQFDRPERLRIVEGGGVQRFIVSSEKTFDTKIVHEGYFNSGGGSSLYELASFLPNGIWAYSPDAQSNEFAIWEPSGPSLYLRSTNRFFPLPGGNITDLDW